MYQVLPDHCHREGPSVPTEPMFKCPLGLGPTDVRGKLPKPRGASLTPVSADMFLGCQVAHSQCGDALDLCSAVGQGVLSQDAAAGHPWFRPAAPSSSSSFLPPFVSPIRTTHPSCSWPSWRAGTTVKMPRGYSIT